MKRTTNLPEDPPPLVAYAARSRPDPRAGGLPGVAAKLSLAAGLFSFLLAHHAATTKVRLSPGAIQGVVLVCVMLTVAGLALSIWAVVANQKQKRPGVTGFAIAGLAVNALLMALFAYYFIRARTGG